MNRYRSATQHIEHDWQRLIYPTLDRVPPRQRSHVLRAARATELDTSERLGIVGAVGVTAYLLQSSSDAAAGLFASTLIQFVLAWPLLAVLVAPWLVRRTRRGLQREAQRFDGGDSCQESQAPKPRPGLASSRAGQERTAAPKRNP